MGKLYAGAHLRPYTEIYRYVAATFFTMIFTLLLETEYGLCAVKTDTDQQGAFVTVDGGEPRLHVRAAAVF